MSPASSRRCRSRMSFSRNSYSSWARCWLHAGSAGRPGHRRQTARGGGAAYRATRWRTRRLECSSSSRVITSGAGFFWRCHHSTTGAMAESLENEVSRRMQSRFRLEKSGLVLAGRGRAVENDALQVLARRLLHAADEFVDLFFCDHCETSLLRKPKWRTGVPPVCP